MWMRPVLQKNLPGFQIKCVSADSCSLAQSVLNSKEKNRVVPWTPAALRCPESLSSYRDGSFSCGLFSSPGSAASESPPVSSSFFSLVVYAADATFYNYFTTSSCLRATEKTIAPSIRSALERQPLKRKLSQISPSFWLEQENKHQQITTAVSWLCHPNSDPGLFCFNLSWFRRCFSSAFSRPSPAFMRQLALEQANNISPFSCSTMRRH